MSALRLGESLVIRGVPDSGDPGISLALASSGTIEKGGEMQTLIMSLSLCLLGFAVCVLTFAAAMGRTDEEASEPENLPRTRGEQFFLDELPPPAMGLGDPAETFASRIRTHVRLEHEAARAFLDLPNADSLHAPTDSPLWQ